MTAKPIVTGTDGSEESLRAVEWAAREAVLRAVPLRIVSAASLLPRTVGLQTRPDRDMIASLIRSERDRALAAAAERAAQTAPGVPVDAIPLQDQPAQAITGSGSGASMLVLGSRGIGAFAPMVLGSVSRYAAAHASCPVVVVRDETGAVHRRIGIGLGHLDDCADSLTFAFEEAVLRQASLIAVHAPGPYIAEEQAAGALEELLNGWQEKYPDVPVIQEVVPGHPARALVGLSARADLVVIGRHAGHPSMQGPGTVRHAVLNHAHGTIVIVPSP